MADRINVPIPEQLRPLADQLAALTADERELVIAAARGGRRLRTIPWDEFQRAKGIAPVGGGDAIADTDALYDDC